MPTTFSRTLRAVETDGCRTRSAALVLLAFLGAWAAWFALGRIPLYEVTETARLEVHSAAHPVTAVIGGRVVETRLRIGQEVRAGDILVVLDAEAEARALLQGADVLLLDESFAALDPPTLQRTLAVVLEEAATVGVIAHP